MKRIAILAAVLAAPAWADGPQPLMAEAPCEAFLIAAASPQGSDPMAGLMTMAGIAGALMALQELHPEAKGAHAQLIERIRAECDGRPVMEMLREWIAD